MNIDDGSHIAPRDLPQRVWICHWDTGNRLDGSSGRIDVTGAESLLEPSDSQRTTNPGGQR